MAEILNFNGFIPKIHPSCKLAPNAVITGNVTIEANTSLWFHTVVRGDVNKINIGEGTNIQDGAVIHGSYGRGDTVIGHNVSVGHRAIVHGCRVEDGVLIGMGAIVLDDAVIETQCVIAAGALVTQNSVCKSGYIYAGIPAKPVKKLDEKQLEFLIYGTANGYVSLSEMYSEFK
jgi:carbonic anhydrase/acetyltransferase-like protein (isoleucine patch superfamily)